MCFTVQIALSLPQQTLLIVVLFTMGLKITLRITCMWMIISQQTSRIDLEQLQHVVQNLHVTSLATQMKLLERILFPQTNTLKVFAPIVGNNQDAGTLGNVTQTTPFGKHLCIALQHSTYKALKLNTQFGFNSTKFAKFMKFVTSKDSKIARFFQSKLCKETWNVKTKCFVNQTIRAELDNFVYVLSNSSQINLEIPIMHLIPNDCEYTVPGDACSSRGGGYCCEFQFWHCMPQPEEMKQRTLKGKRKNSELISINCLELVIIVMSHNSVLDAIELLGVEC